VLEKRLIDIGVDPNKDMSGNSQMLQESTQKIDQFKIYTLDPHFEEKMLYRELKDLKERQKLMHGYTPNEKMRKYLGDCRQSIELAQAASKLTKCDWGIQYSLGLACTLPKPTEMRQFNFMLRADALLLAADGDFHAAFERCLLIRRFAYHVGDDAVILYIMANSIDNSAINCIQFLLGKMKPDVKTLIWLKKQLLREERLNISYKRALEIDFGMSLKSLHLKFSDVLRKQAEKNTEKNILNLTAEDLIERGRLLCSSFLNSSFQVIDNNMPYTEKYQELQRLTDKLKKDAGFDPGALGLIMSCAKQILNIYKIQLRNRANFDALKAAIEIYLIKAETGQLPQVLPNGLPKDPYSGEDFEYKITDDGFVLRCRVKPVNESQARQYEFKVPK
jgi:hypothetical protein